MKYLVELSGSDLEVFQEYITTLTILPRTTRKSLCIGTVGFVCSGKTALCKSISEMLPATLISTECIRALLAKNGNPHHPQAYREIAERAIVYVLENNGNAAFDADNVEREKREQLKKRVDRVGGVPLFVHLTTPLPHILARVIPQTRDWFETISTCEQTRRKIGTILERLPLHYTWSPRKCSWEPKAIDKSLVLNINTASKKCSESIERLVKHIRVQY
jgi:predicted kinase